MNKRERVVAAITHQQPDQVPWRIALSDPARAQVAEYYGDEGLNDRQIFSQWVGDHMTVVVPWEIGFHELAEEVEPGLWRDGWGVIWDTRGAYGEGSWGRPLNCVLPEPTLVDFSLPDPVPDAFSHYPRFIEENREYFIIAMVGQLFEPAWALRGMENLLRDMVWNPSFVDDLLDTLMNHYLGIIDQVVQYDVDACHIGDDWGWQQGLLMGAKYWRRYIKPRMARMFARIKEAGKFVTLHSDGDVSAVFDDLIEIGLDVYNPFQPEIMDVYEMKRQYGDRLCFWGGIGLQSILRFGTPEEVRENAQHMIREIGAGGGYILAQAHPDGILADCPLDNIVALIETVKAQ
jgi:uroporphyrinogen decarboxylase